MRRDQAILQIVSLMLLALVVSAWLWRRLDRSAIEFFGDGAEATVYQSTDPAAPLYAKRYFDADDQAWFEVFADGPRPRMRWRQCPPPPMDSVIPSGRVIVGMWRSTYTVRGIPYFHTLEVNIVSASDRGLLPLPKLEQESIHNLAVVMSRAKIPMHPRWISPLDGLVNSRYASWVSRGPGRYVTEWRWRNVTLSAGLAVVWIIVLPGLTAWLIRGIWCRSEMGRRKLEAAARGDLCLHCGYEPGIAGTAICPECGGLLQTEGSSDARA